MPNRALPIKPFRFGVQLNAPSTGAHWRDTARRIESHGYAVATMPDHFTPQLAPIPALQAVLDVTSTLRAGALVFDNDYKHPAILAKELATMDVLSDGRIEIGLGAGKRVLSVAAREADIVGVNGTLQSGVIGVEAFATMSLDAVAEKVAIVAADAGDRITDIEMNIRTFFVSVTDDRSGAITRTAQMLDVEETLLDASPFALFGSPAKIVEDLLERREQFGFSYVVVGVEQVDAFAPVVAELAGR